MPDQHDLPEGVRRFTPYVRPGTPASEGQPTAGLRETPGGRVIVIDDLPAIRAAAVEEERERLNRGLCTQEGDNLAPLKAARDSVAWKGGAPKLDELQHAIGTFLTALDSDREGE